MGTTSSITVQSLGKIAECAPAVGATTWCMLLAGCREAANCRYRPKIRFFFAPQGRLVAPIQAKLCRADGHVGPLGCAKFHLNRQRGWECGPKISKISTFW